ncbi:MAG: histidine kinase dimerization/phosphoacceptor domain-containing protein, partial [Myxococcota bacterium]
MWWATPQGLGTWPQWSTTLFDDVPPSGRFVTTRDEQTWFVTWTGAVRFDGRHIAVAPPGRPVVRSPVCLDGPGQAWATGQTGPRPGDPWVLVRWEAEGPVAVAPLGHDPTARCATDADGHVWISGREGPRRIGVDGQLEPLAAPIEAWRVFAGPERLWISDHTTLCSVPPVRRAVASWDCVTLDDPELRTVNALVPSGHGTHWLATEGAGLLEIDGQSVRRVPASDAVFGTRTLHGLTPSPRGGTWVVGAQALHRVSGPELTVLETLGRGDGLPAPAADDLAELPNGDVWLSTLGRLAHVPAHVRRDPPAPPLRLQGLEVDGVATSGPDPVAVGSPPNQIELLASAIELRAPSEVRYRVVVDKGPARTLGDGRIQLLDLPPGSHTVEVSASLDGHRWSAPLVRRFAVATPVWRRPWAIGLALLGVLGLAGAVVRARVEVLLARERERVRLAMDLHDELGSGVGSLRLLLGPLARRDLDPALRERILERLRSVTGELHASLQEIVGSLRPGGASVGALVDRLWRRGQALLTGAEAGLIVVLDDAHRA